jgi:hypothetical protein
LTRLPEADLQADRCSGAITSGRAISGSLKKLVDGGGGELADAAGALELGLNVAATTGVGNSAEKMPELELTAGHKLAVTMMAQATQRAERFANSGHVAISIEAGRMATSATKLMLAFQGGMATIARLRGGG